MSILSSIRRGVASAAMALALLTSHASGQGVYPLVAAGDYEEAHKLLLAQVGGRRDAALHFAFLEALILIREGYPDKAAKLLRDILDVAPDFEPARRELAVLLAATGQTEGALFHAETLLATTQDPALRAQLQGFLATQGRAKKRGITTRFAILPSSNANGGTETETVDIGGLPFVIDPASRATRAIGVSIGATAWNRWRLSPRTEATLFGSLDVLRYDTDLIPNETVLATRLDFSTHGARHRLSFGPQADYTWRNGDGYRKRLGLAAAGEYLLRDGLQVGGGLSYFKQDYPGQDFLDGHLLEGSATMRWTVSPKLAVTAGVPFKIERTGRAHLNHRDIGLKLGLEKSWKGGLFTAFSLGYTDARYEGDFPVFGVPRHDRKTTAGLSLRHSKLRFGRFVPEFSVAYTQSKSNVEFYDFDKLDFGISLSQRF